MPVRRSLGPVVGRDREIACLRECWARARAGATAVSVVVFRGEPGTGKSRLAAAAAEMAERSGSVVLELRGSPVHNDAGLNPMRDLIERHCGIGRTSAPDDRLRLLTAEVAARGLDPVRVVPLLAPVLGIGADAGYQPAAAEGRKLYGLIAEAIHDYLLACVGDRAGLVTAEDLHLFDTSTLEVLASLMHVSRGRLLVVVTDRTDRWPPPGSSATVFDLARLTDGQADVLVAALDPALTADERASVVTRCDGLPFYLEQVVNGLRQTGVAEALYEPLFARVRSGTKPLPALDAAAVIGDQMDRGMLRSVINLPDDDVDRAIAELEDALVLESWGTDNWRFRHELLRELAAELAPPSVRRALHAKVADALVGGRGGEQDWQLVAAHYERAERFDAAASAYQKASIAARRRGALAEAHGYLTQALGQLDRGAAGRDRDRREMTVRLERGFLAAALGGQQDGTSVADFERCLQLGGTDVRDDQLFATLAALTGYYGGVADTYRLARLLEPLSVGVEHGREWFRPVTDVMFGILAWLRGEFITAASCFERAAAALGTADLDRKQRVFVTAQPVATAHLHLAWIGMVRGDLARAEAEVALAVRGSDELDFPQGPLMHEYTCFFAAWIAIQAGQLDRAGILLADVMVESERHGFDAFQLVATIGHAAVSGLTALGADRDPGTLLTHAATLTNLLDMCRSLGVNSYTTSCTTFFDAVLGRLLIAAGRPEQARDRLNTGLQAAAGIGMCFYDAELLRLRAHTHADQQARQADITAAADLARRQGATLFELRTALDDFDLRGAPALAPLADAVGRVAADSGCPEVARARALLDRDAE